MQAKPKTVIGPFGREYHAHDGLELHIAATLHERPYLVRVRGGFRAVCPCGWISETKRSQSDVLDRLDSHQRGIRARVGEARCSL